MIEIENSKEYPGRVVEVKFPYCEEWMRMVKQLPHRRWNQDKKCWEIWAVELAPFAKMVGPYNLILKDQSLLTFMDDETKGRDKADADRIKATRERLKDIKPVVPFDFITKPMPHQIEAFNRGINSYNLLIADEQGLGKTLESIQIALYRHSRRQIRKCLIVCGVNSTKYNWYAEIERHAHQCAMIFDQTSSTSKMKAISRWSRNDALFGIINIEAIRPKIAKKQVYPLLSGSKQPDDLPMSDLLMKLNEFVDMVIVDEVHKASHADTQQGLALRQINAPYKIALSGTPMTNQVLDLWNVLSFLGIEHQNYWKFKAAYCVMGGYEGKQIVGYRNLPMLHQELSKVMLRRKKEEVLDLPEKIRMTEYVEMTPAMKKKYREIRDGILETYWDYDAATHQYIKNSKRIESPLAITTRLRQLTGGLILDNSNIKLDRLKELLEESIIPSGNKAVIFSSWEQETSVVKKALDQYHPAYIIGEKTPEERMTEVNRFQKDPECKVCIATIGAGGTGLTLTAGSYVFFMDKPWNQSDVEQAEDRCHRIGTKSNVTVITLVAKNTIDEAVEQKLKIKTSLTAQVVEGKAAYGSKESPEKELWDMLNINSTASTF